jgi:hypothetical protein
MLNIHGVEALRQKQGSSPDWLNLTTVDPHPPRSTAVGMLEIFAPRSRSFELAS